MSATPCRLDGQGFRDFASHMVNGPDVSWLIENGFLCDYKAYAPNDFDGSSLRVRMGDYVKADVELKMMQGSITGNAVAEYKARAFNKRNLVFCSSVDHSIFVRDHFRSQGIRSEHIDGKTDKSERKEILKKFESGEIKVLTSVDLVTTGLDIPAIECITFLRPTQSTSLAIQMMGRGLRPHPGKEHIIYLDHVGLFKKHGLPDDHREWSLDGIKKKPKNDIGSVKICPVCFAAMPSLLKSCKECGHSFLKPQAEKPELNFTADALTEIDKTQFRKTKIDVERSKAKTKDELLALAISRGYAKPHGWVHHIMQSRQRKKLNK
jgi:superfamily II DNA or RNA helicase